MDLALWALGPDSPWDRDRLRKEISAGRQTSLALSGRGIPVHILYWTAFTDNQGALHFRRDIYGWGSLLEKALREKEMVF
jgi:murein L,D-transpeptidase YcbB/YkuD